MAQENTAAPAAGSDVGDNRILSWLQQLPARKSLSTRLRILGWYMLLMGAAMAVALFVQRSILLSQMDDQVNQQLRQEVDELAQLSAGRDPNTGEPFGDDVRAIFSTFLRRNIPVEGEALFTLVGGQPFASTVAPYQLMEDPAIVALWSDIEAPVQREIDSPAGPVRYLAVPVMDTTEQVAGTFVVAMFLDEKRASVSDVINLGALVYGSTFVVASVLAWFAAARALRPVGLLTRTARSITDSSWTERIPVEGDDEIAELAETFNDMLDRLEAAFALQRQFLDDAGHELRTPITVIRGHLEVFGSDQRDEDEVRRVILEELDRMSRLVDDLLLLARAEQPDFLDLHPIDVGELIDEIVARAKPLSERSLTVAERADLVVYADSHRLTQAIMNLVRNAQVHTPPDGPVTVGSYYEDGEVHIWVQDEGPGIPLGEQERIFERFSRGSRARRTEGTGLGLAIVKAIAEGHGGRVSLQSEPGEGSLFTISLPAEEPEPIEPVVS